MSIVPVCIIQLKLGHDCRKRERGRGRGRERLYCEDGEDARGDKDEVDDSFRPGIGG